MTHSLLDSIRQHIFKAWSKNIVLYNKRDGFHIVSCGQVELKDEKCNQLFELIDIFCKNLLLSQVCHVSILCKDFSFWNVQFVFNEQNVVLIS